MNDDSSHIVYEDVNVKQYSILGWSLRSCLSYFSDKFKEVFKSKEFITEFNDFFIPKKLFDFKDVLSVRPKIKKDSKGKMPYLTFSYIKKLSPKNAKKLIFGGKNEKKEPGLIWNPSFSKVFESLDIKKPDLSDEFNTESISLLNIYKNILLEDGEDGEPVDVEYEEEKRKFVKDFQVEIFIVLNNFELTDKLKKGRNKPKNLYNVNYITRVSGKISINFYIGKEKMSSTEPPVATFEFFPKRTEDMEPKESLLSRITNKTAEIMKNPINSIPQNGVLQAVSQKIATGLINKVANVFSDKNVIQDEKFELNFSHEYDKDQISYGGQKNPMQQMVNNPKDDIMESDKISKAIKALNDGLPLHYKIKFRQDLDNTFIDLLYNDSLLIRIEASKV